MTSITSRLGCLRAVMLRHNIQACIIPTNDPHASEYVAEHWKARVYFSGFTGSAGTLVVSATQAGLWTDSRYFLQATEELKGSGITLYKIGEPKVPDIDKWIIANLPAGSHVAMNADLFSVAVIEQYATLFSACGIRIETGIDLIAEAWPERPALPSEPLFALDEKYTGKSVTQKLQLVREQMKAGDADLFFMNALDEIAWLFNIRGTDVDYNPVVIAYAAIEAHKATLFVAPEKLTKETNAYFDRNNIIVKNYQEANTFLAAIGGKILLLDRDKINYSVYEQVKHKNQIKFSTSPILNLKSIKNGTEINGIRLAMQKDGVALTRFARWLESSLAQGAKLTEISVADKLRSFRAEQHLFFGESFAPIVGYKAHGAIVHYSASKNSDVDLKPEGFLLIDSGAQFPHGTTDITRTFALGTPSKKEKRDFTLVLKGHIALAQAVFPAGTCGYQLDVLAKQFLWKNGLTYGHGTGHGVGCFLCVHEGPQNIRPDTNKTPLKEGMVTSNEPGLYITGEYGIRLENLTLVQKSNFSDKNDFFCFETLTLFPFDSKAIDISLLSDSEIAWLNNYHQTVFEKLSPSMNEEEKSWLKEKCQAIL